MFSVLDRINQSNKKKTKVRRDSASSVRSTHLLANHEFIGRVSSNECKRSQTGDDGSKPPITLKITMLVSEEFKGCVVECDIPSRRLVRVHERSYPTSP